jgi:hypothetical protein
MISNPAKKLSNAFLKINTMIKRLVAINITIGRIGAPKISNIIIIPIATVIILVIPNTMGIRDFMVLALLRYNLISRSLKFNKVVIRENTKRLPNPSPTRCLTISGKIEILNAI